MPRFLISRLSALGDVVCTLPVACALKDSIPDVRVTWAVDPRFAGIVECCDAVDEVIRVKPSWKPSSWPDLGAFDSALDLQGLLKSALIVARAKAPVKLGYHWQREAAWLFSQAVLPDPTSLHVVDQYVDVARAAGAEADTARFGLSAKPEDRDRVASLLREHGVADRFVAINAGAGWAAKRWPPNAFAQVIDALADAGWSTVLLGGRAAADQEAANAVTQAARSNPVNLLGQTSVRELVALIDLASAHLGGDTGSTHLAAALGKPAIGIYATTRPERSCPYGQRERCLYDPRGLTHIPAEAVLSPLFEALK